MYVLLHLHIPTPPSYHDLSLSLHSNTLGIGLGSLISTPCTDPIIEPLEFTTRFYEAQNGNDGALGIFGQLLCLVLSVWAVSFGVDEAGEPNQDAGPHAVRQRKERVNVILAELLHLIDTHGVLRKPSCESYFITATLASACHKRNQTKFSTGDGVRILFLVLPLTEGE